jgi:hypothetical protein
MVLSSKRNPVILAFAVEDRHRRRIEAALLGRESALCTGCWDEFERALAVVGCAVAVIAWRHADPAGWRLWRLKERRPAQRFVLITGREADDGRTLWGAPADQIVRLTDLEVALWPAIRLVTTASSLQRVAGRFESAFRADPLLGAALRRTFTTARPFRSLAELATVCGCNRRTLWRHWHATVGAGLALRLEDVLDWVLLLHAVGRKVPGRSWAWVAGELGVSPHTLTRTAARLADRPLRALAAVDQLGLAGEFDERLVASLLRPIRA